MLRHPRPIAIAALAILILPELVAGAELRCGESLRRTLERRAKFDVLSFDAAEGEVVSITVAALSQEADGKSVFDPQWQMEDPAGDVVTLTTPGAPRRCISREHQCETQPLPLTGTYSLFVSDNGTNAAGEYLVTLEAVSATANGQPNGPPEPACARFDDSGKADGTQAIGRGQLVGGAIAGVGETDTFTLTAEAGETLTITLALGGTPRADTFDPRWELFDPSGTPVSAGSGRIDECVDLQCTRGPLGTGGVYTIKVFDGGYDAEGDYSVLVQGSGDTTTTTTTTTTMPPVTSPTTTLPGPVAPVYELTRTLRRTPTDLAPPEQLGFALVADVTGQRLVIGSPSDQTLGPAAGAVFVVSLQDAPPSRSFGELKRSLFRPGGGATGDRFGAAVALAGSSILVGVPGDDVTTPPNAAIADGAAYLFNADDPNVEPLTLVSSRPGGEFGTAVALVDGRSLIGAPAEDGIGRVYLFQGRNPVQTFDARLAESSGAGDAAPLPGDRFGAAIAVSGNEFVFGAPGDATRPGRVFIYDRTSGAWRVVRSLTPTPGDEFGAAVSVVGSAIAVGAPGVGKVFKLTNAARPVEQLRDAPGTRLGASLAPAASGELLAGAPAAGNAPARGGEVVRLRLDGSVGGVFRKPEPEDGDQYGFAVVSAGNRVIIGVPGDDSGSVDGGAAYVYQLGLTAEEAIFRKRLTDSGFGVSLSANATDVVVGAPMDANGRGAVYRFDSRSLCTAGDVCPALGVVGPQSEGSFFGQAVAVLDGTALVGAPFDDADGEDVGRAVLAQATQIGPALGNPEPVAGDQFGFAVAAIENDLLVGAPLLGSTDSGAVFVFDQRSPTRRRLVLRKPTPSAGDFFGSAIAVAGDTVAVGAPFDNAAIPNAGAVYLFRRSTAELVGEPLVSPEPVERELFGSAVAISGDYVVVGAPRQDGGERAPGRAYIFRTRDRTLLRTLESPTREPGNQFGAAVAIVGGTVLVGAPLEDSVPAVDSGTAYLFDAESGQRVQTLDDPAQGAFDRFGSSVAAASSNLVIGAPGPARVYVYRPATATSAADSGLAVRNALVVTAATAGPRCWNGVVEAGERCDDGNTVDTDDCRNDCTLQGCCTIDPLAADRCNDFDPCTTDSLDPSLGCVNVDTGLCCTSDASCAGDGVCRLCAGCSLFPWECCDQGAACILNSPECQEKTCFEEATCECQGGLSCSDGSVPGADAESTFRSACDLLRLEQDGSASDMPPLQTARTSAKDARKLLKKTVREARKDVRSGAISKQCRKEIVSTVQLVRKSIPKGDRLRRCVAEQESGG